MRVEVVRILTEAGAVEKRSNGDENRTGSGRLRSWYPPARYDIQARHCGFPKSASTLLLVVGHCVLNIDGLSQRQRAGMGVGANRPVENLGVQPAVRS